MCRSWVRSVGPARRYPTWCPARSEGRAIARGRFITLEGGEGSGKSTQLKLLVAWLEQAGIGVVATREPGGSPEAEEIRSLIVDASTRAWDGVAEALLIAAARHMHVKDRIEPALAAGSWVICDRFYDSTTAYQGYGRGESQDMLATLRKIAIGTLAPDLTVIIDVDIETGLRRALARRGAETRFEQLDQSFHARLRDGFRAIAAAEPKRCVLIDANRSIEDIQTSIRQAVTERLRVG